MAQSGYTPILIYASGTATNVPLAANLTSSSSGAELALNYADGKLYYKNSSGSVTLLASSTTVTNSFSAGTTGLTPNTATTGAVTLAGTLITSNGGTGLSSYTAGDLPYYASGTALSKLGIGTNGQILTSSGSAPQWSTLSGVAVTTFSAGTTGLTPSSATSGAVTLAGTLATTNGGTGLTSFTANGVVYASSASALATGSALTFDGSNLVNGGNFSTGTSGLATYFRSSGTAYTQIGDNQTLGAGTAFVIGSSSPYLAGNVGGSEGMRLTSTGLGIGTSSPGYKLEVRKDQNASTTIGVQNQNSGASAYSGIDFQSYGGGWQVGVPSSSTFVNPLLFSFNGTERMRLDSSGRLIIGTTTQNGKLTVSGAAGVTSFYGTNGSIDAFFNGGDGTTVSLMGTVGNYPLGFYTNGAERLRLDTSGNLGLGVTPSAWIGSWTVLQQSGVSLASSSVIGIVGQNWYINSSGSDTYINSAAASAYKQTAGAHSWLIAPSGTAGTAITFTQAMTLTAGGNLLVGTTTSATSGSSNIVSAYATGGGVQIAHTNSGGGGLQVALAGGGIATYTYTGAVGSESYTERARIDSSGNFLIGTTSGITSGGVVIQPVSGQSTVYIGHITGTGSGASYEEYYYAGTKIGSITQAGTTGVLYNIASDQRLKENIVDAPEFGSVIDAIQVRSYDWKSDHTHQRAGFIAQELVTVAPEAVHQPADSEEMMAVDYSKLVPMLVKEIQSLRKRLAALEAA